MSETENQSQEIEDFNSAVIEGTVSGDGIRLEQHPRVRYFIKPGPLPAGEVAVVPRSVDGWFSVKPEPECVACKGTGLSKGKNKEEIKCNACVTSAVVAFAKTLAERAHKQKEDRAAEERATRADEKLRAKVEEAKKRVAELEAQRDAALAQNKVDLEGAQKNLEKLQADQERLKGQSAEYDRRWEQSQKEFVDDGLEARRLYDEAVKAAADTLSRRLAQIDELRKRRAEDEGKCRATLKAEQDTCARGINATQEALARLEAGPAKLTKRWEERLAPAKATLQRLERQWKS